MVRFYRTYAHQPGSISERDIDIYLSSYGMPGGMRPGFELIRILPTDIVFNEVASHHSSMVPILAIGARYSMSFAVAENLRPLFFHVEEAIIEDSGHFVLEEKPEELTGLVRSFFSAR